MNFNSFFEEASKVKSERNAALTNDETLEYSKLFVRLAGKNPSIPYEKMVDFMRNSCLRNEFLTEVLLIGLKNPMEQIGQRQFNCLMKLIACKQAGHKLTEALLADDKVPRGLVKLGEEVIFQLSKEDIAEYESQSFFCKNKLEIASFTKASAETLNLVVQLVGFNKKQEMFSTEETIVILHLLKKSQIYNVPKILPAHLMKYLKSEHQNTAPSVTPTTASKAAINSPAASFLQIGQTTNSSSTASLSRPSLPIQSTTTVVSNKALLGNPQPSAQIVRQSSHPSSSATATLFGFNPSAQPKEVPKAPSDISSPTSQPSQSNQSFNLLDEIVQPSLPPIPHSNFTPTQTVQSPQLQTQLAVNSTPNTLPPQIQNTAIVPVTSANALPPLSSSTASTDPNYNNPFAEIESPKNTEPQVKPPQVPAIPVQVEAPKIAEGVTFADIEPLGAKVEELERQKKYLELEIIRIRSESSTTIEELKSSNAKLKELLISTLNLNNELAKQREQTNILVKSLVESSEASIVELTAAKQQLQTTIVTGKMERDRLIGQVRSNQEGLVSLIRQKHEELKQFTSNTNKELADLAKSIDDSKLAIGMEFASHGSPQHHTAHEIKTDLQHDDQEKNWKIFDSNMQQQQSPSSSQWPPLEL